MGCAMGTIRYILFFFNFLLALLGLAILALGIVTIYSNGDTIGEVVKGQLTTPAYIFSIVGACVFLFAFFGCCGALRESHCMICTYAVLLLTLLLLQVAVAVLAFTFQEKTEEVVSSAVKGTFEKYKDNNDTKKLVDAFQQQMKCCGSTDINTPWATFGGVVPDSCYPSNDRSQPKFDRACISVTVTSVEKSLSDIGKVAIAVGVVQIVGVIFSLCLANSIRRSEMRGYA